MAKNYKLFILAGLSGIVLALAYPGWDFNLGFLIWIGFIPLFYALANQSRFSSFLTGFIAGLFYFLIIFRWFWSIYPLDTMGIHGRFASLSIVFVIYVISSAGMAAFWGLFGLTTSFQFLVSGKFKKRSCQLISCLLVIPALFVLLEYARAYGFSLLWAGSGTLFGSHWTMGNLAYALAGNSLALKLSSVAGIYGVIFVIILVNYLAVALLASRPWLAKLAKTKMPIVTMGIFASVLALLIMAPKIIKFKEPVTEKTVNFALIQTDQPTKISSTPKETLDAFKEQLDLLKRVAQEHPESQLIIFPEASDFFKNLSLFLTGPQIPNYFSNLFKEPKLIIAGARIINADGRAYSRVFSLDTQKDIIGFYDKRLLMPGGEFLSYPMKLLVNFLSKTKVSEFGDIREISVGNKKVSTVNFRGQFSVAPLVCSEFLSPSLARKTTEGSDIIVEMASYGVFHGSGTLAKQNLAIARFRAAENQKPLLAASNMGLSYAINSEGSVGFITQNREAQILTGSIALNPRKSWYNKVGDIPVLMGSLVLGILGFGLQVSGCREKNKILVKEEPRINNDKLL
ncbi:MAG: nitrilase-related carbon-nitrogen hydrolase [Patescibacteria group bacterium]